MQPPTIPTARYRPASASDPASAPPTEFVLRRHSEDGRRTREVIVRANRSGERLVIDRDLLTGGQQRLLARIGADEPSSNAEVVCELYLATPPPSRRCRPPRGTDELPLPPPANAQDEETEWAVRASGLVHRLRPLPGGMSIPELRWTRSEVGADAVVSLRSAIALLESYEPLCRHTRSALARFGEDPSVSTTVLQTELLRVLRSPIVLNRGLREAVLTRVRCGETTMSEIAMRCGRCKQDVRGNRSGETSWLARRVGLLPEGGHRAPTPWVHTDVLALIARQGLGVAPREVELG